MVRGNKSSYILALNPCPLPASQIVQRRLQSGGASLIVVILAIYAIRTLTHDGSPSSSPRPAIRYLTETSSTTGKVEAIDDYSAHAKVAGQVEDIYVHVGEKVHAGQLLLKMDDADALAQLATANSELARCGARGKQCRARRLAGCAQYLLRGHGPDTVPVAAGHNHSCNPEESAAARQRRPMKSPPHSIASRRTPSRYTVFSRRSRTTFSQADRTRAQAELADARVRRGRTKTTWPVKTS